MRQVVVFTEQTCQVVSCLRADVIEVQAVPGNVYDGEKRSGVSDQLWTEKKYHKIQIFRSCSNHC